MRNLRNPVVALIAPFALMVPALTGHPSAATVDPAIAAQPAADRHKDDCSGKDDSCKDNSGKDTSGSDNSGKDNSGSDNSGKDTTGKDTSGSDNSGKDNSGTDNSGKDNSGKDNSGADKPKPDDHPTGADDQSQGAKPEPAAGQTVVVGPASGSVRVRLPGSDTFVDLGKGRAVPVGAIVDATKGTVTLTSTSGTGVQTGEFHGATFEVRQSGASKATTDLVLRGGDFAGCPATRHRRGITASAAGSKARVIRSLWGKDQGGRFRTRGRSSVATVRGTAWVTQDRCDGTLTRVTSGAVSVWDKLTKRKVLVRAGHQHLAPASRTR